MVSCEWMGRLGNTMFQIAVVYALAEKYNKEPQFKNHPYFDLPKLTRKPKSFFVQQDGNNDIPDIPDQEDLSIAGFFQRYEYFDHLKEKLLDIFKVPKDWYPNTICVHVRRGDFLYDPINFPTQPVSYYMQALESLGYKNKKVVFCSDDIKWCKINFPFAEFRANTSEIDDIYFGANCDGVVMSNSTFSFWMAYLNLRKREIYFPLNWFSKTSGRNGYEICPKNWIGI